MTGTHGFIAQGTWAMCVGNVRTRMLEINRFDIAGQLYVNACLLVWQQTFGLLSAVGSLLHTGWSG